MTAWNWPKMDLNLISSLSSPSHSSSSSSPTVNPMYRLSSQPYVPTFKYFLVVTALWNFLYSFLSSIPRNIFGFHLKFQIFFGKLTLFHVRVLEHFCDHYSSIVPTFVYLRVTTALCNFLHSFFSLIPRNVFGFISKFQIFFEKLKITWKKIAVGTVSSYRVTSTF